MLDRPKPHDNKHKTPKGVKVNVWTHNPKVAEVCFKHYDTYTEIGMKCPFCSEDIWGNSLDGERVGKCFNDTYTCDDCDVLVTLITPYADGEYHNVHISDCEYLIEFMGLGTPSNWPDDSEAE